MAIGVPIVVTITRKLLGSKIVSVYVMTECNCGKNDVAVITTNCLAKTEFCFNGEDQGTYYPDSNRCVVYLNKHESLEDITKTIDHEVFHYCVDKLDIKIDDEQEHKAIYYLQWADEYIAEK
tara:strand:- start:69 stop:434 length:366 start_codon:yes stop_codon:yes gene_type:complete